MLDIRCIGEGGHHAAQIPMACGPARISISGSLIDLDPVSREAKWTGPSFYLQQPNRLRPSSYSTAEWHSANDGNREEKLRRSLLSRSRSRMALPNHGSSARSALSSRSLSLPHRGIGSKSTRSPNRSWVQIPRLPNF